MGSLDTLYGLGMAALATLLVIVVVVFAVNGLVDVVMGDIVTQGQRTCWSTEKILAPQFQIVELGEVEVLVSANKHYVCVEQTGEGW